MTISWGHSYPKHAVLRTAMPGNDERVARPRGNERGCWSASVPPSWPGLTRPSRKRTWQRLSTVMRGLDPRIHDESQRVRALRAPLLQVIMDCRVKPGNDHLLGGIVIRSTPSFGRLCPAMTRDLDARHKSGHDDGEALPS